MRSFSIGNVVVLGLLLASGAAAEVNGPTLGKAAPPLNFSQVLHALSGAGTTWEALRGQVVVLDFWATWCGPCRKALPHWNELADAFKDKQVRLIAITDENVQVVESFLKQTPIHSWVALEGLGRSNLDTYNIRGIPTTVIANQQGVVVAVIPAAKLQPKDIDEVLRTGQSSLPPPTDMLADLGSETQVVVVTNHPVYEISVRRSGPVPKGRGFDCWTTFQNSADVTGEYASVKKAILTLFDGRPSLFACRTILPSEQYDFTVKLPPSATHADREQAVAPLFRDLFGLYIHRENEQRDAYILTVASTNAPGLVPFLGGMAGGGSERGGLKLRGATFDWLPSSLEELLGKPVLNETGVTNRYNIHLKWKMPERELKREAGPDPDAIIAAVRDQLGLNLSLQRRSLPVLIVDQARGD